MQTASVPNSVSLSVLSEGGTSILATSKRQAGREGGPAMKSGPPWLSSGALLEEDGMSSSPFPAGHAKTHPRNAASCFGLVTVPLTRVLQVKEQ